jgi:hypothetical protein
MTDRLLYLGATILSVVALMLLLSLTGCMSPWEKDELAQRLAAAHAESRLINDMTKQCDGGDAYACRNLPGTMQLIDKLNAIQHQADMQSQQDWQAVRLENSLRDINTSLQTLH